MRTNRSAIQIVAAIVAAGTLLAAGAGLQYLREQRYPRPTVSRETLYITSSRALRQLTKGYNALAADLYWIRAVQYFGRIRLGVVEEPWLALEPDADKYELLHPLLDLTTSLDPHFNIAYRFGAIFLAEPFPGGAGRPDLAVALLQKGYAARADKWEYMWDIGFVHYWWHQDYAEAAKWFDRASKVPNAPWWLRSLAANTLAQGGDRQSSRAMWETIRQTAEVEYLRQDAERKLAQLQAMDEIDALQQAVNRFRDAAGALPGDWMPLVRGRMLRGIPVDPSSTPYEIDQNGRVGLSRRSPLFPLPADPKRPALPVS
jgi:tetratricopeptide (TPR) repeat protein